MNWTLTLFLVVAILIGTTLGGVVAGEQQGVLIGKAISLGYSIQELQTHFPNDLGTYTLRDMLNFILTRRLDPRWDPVTQTIILDGTTRSCKSADQLDREVPDTLVIH
jgi:hypothetical protein